MNGPQFWDKLIDDLLAIPAPPNQFAGARYGGDWNITVAGGAVRDWVLGEEPNDIDVFISHRIDLEEVPLTPPGWEFLRAVVGNEEYPGAGERFNVYEYMVEGTRVQTMMLQHGLHPHYAGFDYNMTKAYYQKTAGIVMSREFSHGLDRMQMWQTGRENPANTPARMQAQLARPHFAGWTVVENPLRVAVNPVPAAPNQRWWVGN